MTIEERIEAFSKLGKILRDSLSGKTTKYSHNIEQMIESQHLKNPWFTPENVKLAIKSIAGVLTPEKLKKWTDAYPYLHKDLPPINIGVIMAGNIPLVGFHDFLSVLISGNNIIARTSSKDKDLLKFLGEVLSDINEKFRARMIFTDGTLREFDAVIATGSDNSSRYFEYYFGKYPHIIRKNRSSIAFINGMESDAELVALGIDVFSYFGLGCRNVSKLYIPEGYDPERFTQYWNSYEILRNHSGYANNYDFNKAVFLVNREKFIDTGYLLIKENEGLASPVAVLHYSFYKSYKHFLETISLSGEKLQCITGYGFIPFGNAQLPELWDYADGIDTLEFILKINYAGIL